MLTKTKAFSVFVGVCGWSSAQPRTAKDALGARALFHNFMTHSTAMLLMLVFAGFGGMRALGAEAVKPNVVFILTDDMGWGDLGCYGGARVKTTNLDRLASEGTRFQQFYVASPICSPSRVAITTGMYPARWHINSYLHTREGNRKSQQADWLDLKAPTLARAFKQSGYATGHFGKWHMGGGRDVDDAPLPSAYGFDEHFVNSEGMGPRIPGFGGTGPEIVEGKPMMRHKFTEFFVNKTIDFMRRHKDGPFFVNLWPMDVHDPHKPSAEEEDKFNDVTPAGLRRFYGVLDEYDHQMGRLLNAIKDLGLEQNTIVLFMSDNGPNPSFQRLRSGQLRGQKWSLYEGGIREPFIARWPGHIPAHQINESTVMATIDLFPTLCSLTGIHAPENAPFDGVDQSAVLLGKPSLRTKPILWEYGRTDYYLKPTAVEDQSPNVCIRDGNWKLLINADGSNAQLYDLATDPKETTNLTVTKPKLAERLSNQALAWRKSLP
jgi:arylsulfatase A-like enzyme